MKLAKRSYILLAASLVLALAVAASALVNRAESVTLPAGTVIQVQLNHSLASNQHRAGDAFEARVTQAVMAGDKVAIPRGADARGVVVYARESGRLKGVAQLRLALEAVEVNGTWYDVSTSSVSRRGPDHKVRNWAWIGGSAAGGALIGGLAGGGKGVLIGGPLGAGAGTAVAALTGKREVRFPAESLLTFKISEPVTIEAQK